MSDLVYTTLWKHYFLELNEQLSNWAVDEACGILLARRLLSNFTSSTGIELGEPLSDWLLDELREARWAT